MTKVLTLIESIADILRNLEDEEGATMFSNVNMGFFPPDKSSNFPMAAIGVPEEGGFQSEKGLAVEGVEMILPVFAYFYIEKTEEANSRLLGFLQRLVYDIEDMKFTWFDPTVHVIAGDFRIGDVLREMGHEGYELELLPPFYGIRLELRVRINDNSM